MGCETRGEDEFDGCIKSLRLNMTILMAHENTKYDYKSMESPQSDGYIAESE